MNLNTFLKKHNLTLEQYYGNEPILHNINLGRLTVYPVGFNPSEIHGKFIGNNILSLPENFSPTIINGSLEFKRLKHLPKNFSPKLINSSLLLNGIETLIEDFNLHIEGDVVFNSLKSIKAKFKPIINGQLFLNNLVLIKNNFDPIVTKHINLKSFSNIFKKEIKRLRCAGSIWYDCRNNYVKNTPVYYFYNIPKTNYIFIPGDSYNGIKSYFGEKLETVGEVTKCKKFNSEEVFYFIHDGLGGYGAGSTKNEAQKNMKKFISLRTKEDFKYKLTDILYTFEACLFMYRIISDVCENTLLKFLKTIPDIDKNKSYSLNYFIKYMKDWPGHKKFLKFFKDIKEERKEERKKELRERRIELQKLFD